MGKISNKTILPGATSLHSAKRNFSQKTKFFLLIALLACPTIALATADEVVSFR